MNYESRKLNYTYRFPLSSFLRKASSRNGVLKKLRSGCSEIPAPKVCFHAWNGWNVLNGWNTIPFKHRESEIH